MDASNNMITSTREVVIYRNMLEAHTAFVLDRYAFMENIQNAVLAEDVSGSCGLFRILADGNFVELIGGLVCDPDLRNRDQAFFTLANLLALEHNDELVSRAVAVVLEKKGAIFQNLYNAPSDDIQRSTAYVVHNLMRVFTKRDWDFDSEEQYEKGMEFAEMVLDVFNGLLGGNGPLFARITDRKALHDLRFAVKMAADKDPMGPRIGRLVCEIRRCLDRPGHLLTFLDMLGMRLSETGNPADYIPEEFHDDLLDLFHVILEDDANGHAVHRMALWALSNFVVETDVADKAATFEDLMTTVIDKALTGSHTVRANAVWTLANIVMSVTSDKVKEMLSENAGLFSALMEAIEDAHDLRRWRADVVAGEALGKITTWQALFRPLLEDSDDSESEATEEDDESEASDDSDDSDWTPEKDGEEESDDDDESTVADEAEEQADETMTAAVSNDRIPTALDLMNVGRIPSETVRRLVALLQAEGYTSWAVIPAGTTLTIEDLTTLQMMGYYIYHGHIGVNPTLMNYI